MERGNVKDRQRELSNDFKQPCKSFIAWFYPTHNVMHAFTLYLVHTGVEVEVDKKSTTVDGDFF